MTNTKRITKAMRFADIQSMLNGNIPANGTTIDEAVSFIDNEIALLTKKNTAEKKPTSKQIENDVFKKKILDYLMTQTNAVTCTDVQKNIPEFADFNNQKIAALMRQLVDEHKITRNVVKGRSIFAIA